MAATFQVVALSSRDPEGRDTADEPKLLYPDALKTARQLREEGKAFRVFVNGDYTSDQLQALTDLGALE